jgi:hypothetical protein
MHSSNKTSILGTMRARLHCFHLTLIRLSVNSVSGGIQEAYSVFSLLLSLTLKLTLMLGRLGKLLCLKIARIWLMQFWALILTSLTGGQSSSHSGKQLTGLKSIGLNMTKVIWPLGLARLKIHLKLKSLLGQALRNWISKPIGKTIWSLMRMLLLLKTWWLHGLTLSLLK